MQSSTLDERELALLHALQIAPRVPWAEAGRILGTTPATLAGRWERLRSRGLAWVTAHPSGTLGDIMVSFVEVDCAPGRQAGVLDMLCKDPRAVTIELSARGRDLFLTVMTPDLSALTKFVLDDLLQIPGVQRQRTYLATAIHRQGRDWRLDSLDPEQQLAFERVGHAPVVGDGRLPRDAWPLIEALARDGRATAADLARTTGRNPATVRRQLARVLASGVLSFRCEIAQEPSLWPLHFSWLARVSEQEKERTVTAIATLPELRLCVSTTGETNLLVSVWVRSQTDLLRLERVVGEKLPWLTIVESVFNLRTAKRMGWMIDARGRATGEFVVPTALYAAQSVLNDAPREPAES